MNNLVELPLKPVTLRDYFAAQAMAALLSEPIPQQDELSAAAYRVADAMLKAREQ